HALVEPGHWRSETTTSVSGRGDNFAVQLDQTPDGGHTGIFMTYEAGVLTGVTFNVDEGGDLFLVQPGTEFSRATVMSGSQAFIGGASQYALPLQTSGPLQVGTDFYVGGRTRSYSDPGFHYGDFFTVYGWAHF